MHHFIRRHESKHATVTTTPLLCIRVWAHKYAHAHMHTHKHTNWQERSSHPRWVEKFSISFLCIVPILSDSYIFCLTLSHLAWVMYGHLVRGGRHSYLFSFLSHDQRWCSTPSVHLYWFYYILPQKLTCVRISTPISSFVWFVPLTLNWAVFSI